MATARHPTVDAVDDAPTDDEAGERPSSDRPPIGIDHRTVVPTNLDRDD